MPQSATIPVRTLPFHFGDLKIKALGSWKWALSHSLVFLAAGCGILSLIALWIAATDKIVVGPFSVPKEYEERGYTSEAMSNAVLQFIRGNESTVSISQRAEDQPELALSPTSDDQDSFEDISAHIDGRHVVSSFDQSNIPDIKVPLTSFSVQALIEMLRATVGRQPTHIAAEIVALKEADSPASGQSDPQNTGVLIRYKIDYPESSSSILGYHWLSRRTTTVAGTLTANGAEEVIRKLALITADGLGRRTLPAEGERSQILRLINRGNIYFALSDYGTAEDMYKLANQKEESGHAYLGLGAIEESKGNFEKALADYTKAASTSHVQDDDDATWASLYQANLLWRRKEFDKAESKYLGLTRMHSNPHTFLVQADAQTNLGFLHLFRKDWTKAERSFDTAKALAERLHTYAWNCALSSGGNPDCQQPNEKADALINLQMTNHVMASIHYGLAQVSAKDDGPRVERELREAIQFDSGYYRGHYHLARVYIAQKRYRKAQEELQKTIQIEPGFKQAYDRWKDLIDRWASLPEKQKSDKPLKRTLASAYKTWGDSFTRAGNPDEASERYCQAAQLDLAYKGLCKEQSSE